MPETKIGFKVTRETLVMMETQAPRARKVNQAQMARRVKMDAMVAVGALGCVVLLVLMAIPVNQVVTCFNSHKTYLFMYFRPRWSRRR